MEGLSNEKCYTLKEKFDMTVNMGELILVNGGELFRAHETMVRMADYFELQDFETYMLANGIFSSTAIDGQSYSCQIRYSPLQSIELSRVEAVNDLSRGISAGKYSIAEIEVRLKAIATQESSGSWLKIIAAGASAWGFCYLFGGTMNDSWGALIAGLIMYFILQKGIVRTDIPKMMISILSSFLAAGACSVLYYNGLGDSLNHMIVGAIFPLVPGVAFTNGIRNLLENDYLTGLIRLANATISAVCIAIGVGLVLSLTYLLGGVV